MPGVVAIGFSYTPPAFCGSCGAPYPWTEARLAAAREMAKDLEALNETVVGITRPSENSRKEDFSEVENDKS